MGPPVEDRAPSAPGGFWRVLGLAVALGLLAWAFRGAEGSTAIERAARLWPFLPLLLLPSALGTLCDVGGWKLLLAPLGHRPGWLALVRVRLSADALLLGLPFGSLVSEGATPGLLARFCGVPLPEALAVLTARRTLLALAHSFYLGLGAAMGVLLVRAAGGKEGLHQWLLLLLAGALLAFTLVLTQMLRGGEAAQSVRGLLERIPVRCWRDWVRGHARTFTATDERLGRVLGAQGTVLRAVPVFLASWFMETLEAVVLLGLLGSGLGWLAIFPVESSLSVVRSLAVFAPAGLGAQDLGYAQMLARLAVTEPLTTAAAFTLLRRGKEACWILLGIVSATFVRPGAPFGAARLDPRHSPSPRRAAA
jgi:glycosyltransferase 2 family protein